MIHQKDLPGLVNQWMAEEGQAKYYESLTSFAQKQPDEVFAWTTAREIPPIL